MKESWLVTGALGCIGAWTVKALAEEGVDVAGYDLGTNDGRITSITDAKIDVVRGDITDRAALDRALDDREVTHVVHLAALLLPLIKKDPPNGTAVNVVGTTNVLDAAKTRGIQVAYASSAAVFSRDDPSPVAHDADGHPTSWYGVHKQACEGMARVFWDEEQVPSIGLRPYIVYGPGRDVGITAGPSLAMAAAARGEPYTIPFGGVSQLQFAPDAAAAFISAARAAREGAAVYNLGTKPVHMSECVAAIESVVPGAEITFDDVQLPFPDEYESESLERAVDGLHWTSLKDGVRQTVEHYRAAG
ncbi:MAG: UDP-glucuronate 4-epimerase [Gaiellaceae bacterium]|nr:UDP-glucuronate 4-epimerase [Gaiellaceae bacterium]